MIRPVYILGSGAMATLCTSCVDSNGSMIPVPKERMDIFQALPQTIPAKVGEINQNIKLITSNMYNKIGLATADQNGAAHIVRLEAGKRTVQPQKLKITLNASGAPAGNYYVALGGGLKAQNLLKTQAGVNPLPITVTIGGTDGTETVNYLNDFAIRGFVVKGLQVDASSANLYTSGVKPVQHYSLQNETSSQINTSEFDVQWGISDMSNNLTQRKFDEVGPNKFTARVDTLQGVIFGVYGGYSVTYTLDFYSSANGVNIYELVD